MYVNRVEEIQLQCAWLVLALWIPFCIQSAPVKKSNRLDTLCQEWLHQTEKQSCIIEDTDSLQSLCAGTSVKDEVEIDIVCQGDMLIQVQPDHNGKDERAKRQVLLTGPTNKWDSHIIPYSISDISDSGLSQAVKSGLYMIEKASCIRFSELDNTENITFQYLGFQEYFQIGCFSYIGKVQQPIPQPIYLGPSCTQPIVVAHEVLHSLGILHEHQRYDRDSYVQIFQDNLISSQYITGFRLLSNMEALQLPYDYASMMHYSGQAFSNNNGPTIKALQSAFQSTMGQRVELSFFDGMLLNLVYCQDVCNDTAASLECVHGGYQDPKNCSQCRCPDGWTGRKCDQLASFIGDSCGGEIHLDVYQQTTITSPAWGYKKSYPLQQECTWLINFPSNSQLRLDFQSEFGIYEEDGVCNDWLEIRDGNSLGYNGPRFCGSTVPEQLQVITAGPVLALFRARSNETVDTGYWKGFNLTLSTEELIEADLCAVMTCINGHCVLNNSQAVCLCSAGYTGKLCESPFFKSTAGNAAVASMWTIATAAIASLWTRK